jgi:hypothetical protein
MAIGALVTAAAITDQADVLLSLDGSRNTFDIQTAGAAGHGWRPSATSWEQGNPTAYEVSLGDETSGAPLPPGGSIDLTIAVRNASPSLAGLVGLRITDPDPLGHATDPTTGAYLELFDQLRFTIADHGTVIAEGLTAAEFDHVGFTWPEPLDPEDDRSLDVTISLPASVDNRWMGAGTSVLFDFEGENA